jgi:hypothetical protein
MPHTGDYAHSRQYTFSPIPLAGVMMKAWPPLGTCGLALLLLVAQLSCDDSSKSPQCPLDPLGTVEGYVLGAGEPVAASVSLAAFGLSNQNFDCSARSDSTGWFSLTVPADDYLLRLSAYDFFYYSDRGPVRDDAQADTIVLGGEPLRIDFSAGAITVRTTVPGELEDECLRCELYTYIDESFRRCGSRPAHDGNGFAEFDFAFVTPGTYWMQLRVGDHSVIWLPATLKFAEADTIHIEDVEHLVYETTLPPPGRITGQITGSWQRIPEAYPKIRVFADDSTEVFYVKPASSGDFEILLPVPSGVRLLVEIEDVAQWIGGSDFADATRFEPESGEVISDVSVVESGIACTVRGPDLRHVRDADCYLYDAAGVPVNTASGSPCSYNPRYFCNLRTGSYFLFVDHDTRQDTWAPQWYDQAAPFAEATPILIQEAGEVVEITVQLVEGGRILGRVLKASGKPAIGALVVLRTTDGEYEDRWAAESNYPDGNFAILGVADGTYVVGVRLDWERSYWFPGTYDPALAEPIQIEDAGTVTEIVWETPL